MKFSVIIPARISSTRFPGKVLYEIKGLPMIEHVRRRALMSLHVQDVIVATCDEEIQSIVKSFNGNVIMTSANHNNGTQRISEASKQINSDYVILLQGDEPCIFPSMIDDLIKKITKENLSFYNAVCPINDKKVLYDKSSVKCAVDSNSIIKNCFRISPYTSSFLSQKKFIFKMLGLMAFENNLLKKVDELPLSNLAQLESIEQLNLLYNNIILKPYFVENDPPSVNYKKDLDSVFVELNKKKQKNLLTKSLKI